MPVVSDYAIITDSFKKLQQDQPGVDDPDETFHFTVPDNYHQGSRAVVTWEVGLGNLQNLRYRLLINEVEKWWMRWTGTVPPTTQQVVLPHHALKPGENTARFQITDGGGTVDIYNAVVYFQATV